jgi:probable HAF family extracellular repeat protein
MPVYTYTRLDDPLASGPTTTADGINGSGQIVGGYFDSSFHGHGFLYSNGTYTTLDDPMASQSTFASGINDAGQIVGQYSDATGNHGFLYSNGAYTTLNDPLAKNTILFNNNGTLAEGINDAGQIVGIYFDATVSAHGFFFVNGFYATLDATSAGETFATGINNVGQIVGYYIDGLGTHGFLYNPNSGTYTTLDAPGSVNGPGGLIGTPASGINDAGQIVGRYEDANLKIHGFLYSNGSYITLDDPLAPAITLAFGINDAGQIAGTYHSIQNSTHGFLLTITPNLPPPPGTTADMILRHGSDGLYEIYDIGNNAILAAYQLGQVGTDWQFAGLGDFNGADTTDMMLRNSNTGAFEIYNISNAASLGTVGLTWGVGVSATSREAPAD